MCTFCFLVPLDHLGSASTASSVLGAASGFGLLLELSGQSVCLFYPLVVGAVFGVAVLDPLVFSVLPFCPAVRWLCALFTV
jgi:hypothetical protein